MFLLVQGPFSWQKLTKEIAHLLTYATTFSCRHFMSHNEKAWKFKRAL